MPKMTPAELFKVLEDVQGTLEDVGDTAALKAMVEARARVVELVMSLSAIIDYYNAGLHTRPWAWGRVIATCQEALALPTDTCVFHGLLARPQHSTPTGEAT